MLMLNFLFFFISAVFLILSGTYLVKSLSKISHFLRISEFTAAFIIMALATTAPELFVGISSALSGVPSLSLGNVIGASIIDLTLLVGIFTLLGKGIKIKSRKIGKEVYYVLFSILLMVVLFIINQSLSRIDGIILLCFFIFNAFRILKKRKKFKTKLKHKKIKNTEIVYNSFIFIIALLILFISARYAVKYASLIAIDLKLPQIIMGLFLISIATTLPEFIFGIRAIMMKHKEMALGDLTGATIANISLVAGITAVIHPIKIALAPFLISAIFLFISAFIFITFLKSEKEIKIGEGVALILLYIFFIIIEFLLK